MEARRYYTRAALCCAAPAASGLATVVRRAGFLSKSSLVPSLFETPAGRVAGSVVTAPDQSIPWNKSAFRARGTLRLPVHDPGRAPRQRRMVEARMARHVLAGPWSGRQRLNAEPLQPARLQQNSRRGDASDLTHRYLRRNWARQFTLRPQSQLTAGGIDVMTFLPPQSGVDPFFFQSRKECFLPFLRRPFPGQTLDLVVRDQVHFSIEPSCQKRERLSLPDVIINAGY